MSKKKRKKQAKAEATPPPTPQYRQPFKLSPYPVWGGHSPFTLAPSLLEVALASGGSLMAQAPTKTYADTLLDLADLTYKARLRQGQSKAEAERQAMLAVVASVKGDIQRTLRADRWTTAAAVLDLWSAERGIPLGEEEQ